MPTALQLWSWKMHSQTFVFQQLSVGCYYWNSCLLVRPTSVLCAWETHHFRQFCLFLWFFFFHSWIWQCSKWVWWFGHFRNRACKVRKLSSIFCWAFLTRSNCLSFFKMQLWNSTPNILLWRSGDSWDLRNSTFIFNMSWSCNIRSFLLFAKTICNMC